MKRHLALQDLSRDHQLLLLQCRQIRWLEEGDHRAHSAEATLRDFFTYWETDGRVHIEVEETVLLPRLRGNDERLDAFADAMTAEHAVFIREVAGIYADPTNVHRLHALGGLLEKHVRFEERIVFETTQTVLSIADMDALWTASIAFREVRRGADRIGARGGRSCVVKKR